MEEFILLDRNREEVYRKRYENLKKKSIFVQTKNFSQEKLKEVTAELVECKPDFISVTYGAGGQTKGGTIEMASHIKNNLKTEVLAHLTCVGSKKSEIHDYLQEAKSKNVKNILALRGDVPQGETEDIYNKGDYKYASELISDLRKNSEFDDFSIGGAFYPETHYENNDLIDLFHLKNKVEAGTDFLTSQMFFDNDIFIKFKEKAEKLDIKVPLVAGIMPVTNAKQIKRIIELSKCSVPQKLDKLLEKYGDNPESMKKAGIMYASEQIIELLAYGIKGIHIYTMNKPEIAKEIMKNIEFAR